MEENEKEVIDETIEEKTTTQEDVNESEEDTNDEESSDTPSLEDYLELKKKAKTLEAQKEHWRKKAEIKTLESKPATKETNTEYLTRDEAILLTKGYDDEDLAKLNMLANGKKLTEVANDEMFIAWKEKKDNKVKAQKAQLGSSKGSTKTSKPLSEMTREEHMAYWKSMNK